MAIKLGINAPDLSALIGLSVYSAVGLAILAGLALIWRKHGTRRAG